MRIALTTIRGTGEICEFKNKSTKVGEGVDFIVKTDQDVIGIEVKNQSIYSKVYPPGYERDYRSRFDGYEYTRKLVIMRKQNIPLVEEGCKRDNIDIIGLPQQILPDDSQSKKMWMLRHLKKELRKYFMVRRQS